MNPEVELKVKRSMKIGEVAERTGVSASAIRFYEREGLIPSAPRTSGGYRVYDDDIVDRIVFVRRAQDAGLALVDVKDILGIHDSGQAPCGHVQDVLAKRLESITAQMRDLQALQQHLQSLLQRAETESVQQQDTAAVCWILETAAPHVKGGAGGVSG